LCAAGVGAPHIRQRLWFVGERLADAHDAGLEGWAGVPERAGECVAGARSVASGLADAEREQREECLSRPGQGNSSEGGRPSVEPTGFCSYGRTSPTNGHWRDADWLHCRDGKWRPVEPGTFPLVDGAPARVGRLRAYGNAIVPQAAAEVIGAYLAT
jgi:DNA (cytosine-5)-methyltransferase 1